MRSGLSMKPLPRTYLDEDEKTPEAVQYCRSCGLHRRESPRKHGHIYCRVCEQADAILESSLTCTDAPHAVYEARVKYREWSGLSG